MAALKVVLILTLAVGINAKRCQDYWGAYNDNSFGQREARYKHMAMSADSMWKMKRTIAAGDYLDDEVVKKCDSCADLKTMKKKSWWPFANKTTPWEDFSKLPAETPNPAIDKDPVVKKVYFVNMAHQGGKAGAMYGKLGWLNDIGIPVERWPGTYKDEASDEAIGEFTWGTMDYVLATPFQMGTKACYLSQARLMKHILEEDPDGEDWYVVFEDDASPWGDWMDRVKDMLKNKVPEDVDIFKFGYWGDTACQNYLNDEIIEPRVDPGPDHLYAGNQGYMIRPRSIPKVLEQFKSLGLMDVDGAMGSMHTEWKAEGDTGGTTYGVWGVVQYVSSERFCGHDGGGSDRLSFKQKNLRKGQIAPDMTEGEEPPVGTGPGEQATLTTEQAEQLKNKIAEVRKEGASKATSLAMQSYKK